jgi:hypothetical protein
MNKFFIILLLIPGKCLYAQQNVLQFKKNSKTISSYWVGMSIACQLQDRQWQKGIIQKINTDSIYIQPKVVRYFEMGTDTVTLPVVGFPITDIRAMPKRGYLIDYKYGSWQISRTGGHVHFYWIKSGYLFRIGAVGYMGAAFANQIFNKTKVPPAEIAASAGVLGVGVLLKYLYKPYIKTGKKYHFTVMNV